MSDISAEDFGTEPRKLRRNDHPDTSHAAAETVDTERFEELAFKIIQETGLAGCTLDDLREGFERRAPPRTQYGNRRTGIHHKGLVLDTGGRRTGYAGRQQAVYVATCELTPEWLEYVRNSPTAHNPCLWEDTVKSDNVDDPTLLFYTLRHGVSAASRDLDVPMKRCKQVREAHLAAFRDHIVDRHGLTFWKQINQNKDKE